MYKELYEWLKKEWRENNVPKYQHYFEEWCSNMTDNQITGFDRMRLADYINHEK